MRRDLHVAFAVSATYEDDSVVVPTPITVRWHNKSTRIGDIQGGDYAEVLETIDRLLFDSEEIATAAITLKRGGIVTLTEFGNTKFELDVREPADGPIKIVWTVTRPNKVAP
jgi:hypothetical protein